MGEPELGYVSLHELAAVRGKLGLPIERDLHFEADKTISAYYEEARERTKFGSAAAAPGIRNAASAAGVGTGSTESLAVEGAGCALAQPAKPHRPSAAITRDIFFMGIPLLHGFRIVQ
jgi:Protein of unknown function (DUF2958)